MAKGIGMKNLTLLIKPSSSMCNMRCKYCFYVDVAENRAEKSYDFMSGESLELLVKKALTQAEISVSFAFQGGEPTLVGLDFYRKLVDLQKKYNKNKITVYNSIQTNGFIIDDDWARFFYENHFLVGLSLDGYQEVHDFMRVDSKNQPTFHKVMNTVKLFNRYQVEYNILCVVNNFVAKHAEKIYSFFKRNHFKYLQFIPCLDGFDSNRENYSLDNQRYLNFLKVTFNNYYNDFLKGDYTSIRTFDNWISMLLGRPPESCGMAGVCSCYFVVESNLSVYPCDFYVLDEWKIGNLFEHDFLEMKNSESSIKFVELSKSKDEKCNHCKWYPLCRGGCRRNREPMIDGKLSSFAYCEAYKEFFAYAYPKMLEIAKRC